MGGLGGLRGAWRMMVRATAKPIPPNLGTTVIFVPQGTNVRTGHYTDAVCCVVPTALLCLYLSR